MSQSLNGQSESSGKPKISDFESASAINEQILRFEVSMNDSSGVAVVDSVAQLVEKQFDLI